MTNEHQKPAVSEQAEARCDTVIADWGQKGYWYCCLAEGHEGRHISDEEMEGERVRALEAQVTQLQQQLEEAQGKAALAEEIRREREQSHTVYWWAGYLAEFERRWDALTAGIEEGAGE